MFAGTVISKIIEDNSTALGSMISIPGGAGGHSVESVEDMQKELQARRNDEVFLL